MKHGNKQTSKGVYYNVYIATWTKVCRSEGIKPWFGSAFEEWLRRKEGLNENEIADIVLMATTISRTLEESAHEFIKENPDNPYFVKD